MNRSYSFILLIILFSFLLNGSGKIHVENGNMTVNKPLTAEEIVKKSYEAHGGKALTDWESMVIKGEINMWISEFTKGEYLGYVQKPDKVRIERNMTKYTGMPWNFTDIHNDNAGWTIINLIPTHHPVYTMFNKRRFNQMIGIAYYINNADSLILQPEAVVKGDTNHNLVDRPAYVIRAKVKNEETTLYIDKENFYLIQEEFMIYRYEIRKVFSDFKKFGNMIIPAYRIEYGPGEASSKGLGFITKSIKFNVPIDPKLFDEEKAPVNK